MPMIANVWFQEEYTLGTAELGEKCYACRIRFLGPEAVIVKRLVHPETGSRSLPVAIYCHPCADGGADDIRIGAKGQLVKASSLRGDVGTLVQQFWQGLRDNNGRARALPDRVKKYWVMGQGYGTRGGRELAG